MGEVRAAIKDAPVLWSVVAAALQQPGATPWCMELRSVPPLDPMLREAALLKLAFDCHLGDPRGVKMQSLVDAIDVPYAWQVNEAEGKTFLHAAFPALHGAVKGLALTRAVLSK